MGAWCPPSVAASSASPVPPALRLYPAVDRDGVHRELDPEHLALDLPGEIGWHSSSVFLVREDRREHLCSVFPGELLEHTHHNILTFRTASVDTPRRSGIVQGSSRASPT